MNRNQINKDLKNLNKKNNIYIKSVTASTHASFTIASITSVLAVVLYNTTNQIVQLQQIKGILGLVIAGSVLMGSAVYFESKHLQTESKIKELKTVNTKVLTPDFKRKRKKLG